MISVQGDSFKDAFKNSLQNIAINAIGELGANEIGKLAHPTDQFGNRLAPTISKPTQLALHASLGATTSALKGDNILSGAVSGIIGEVSAEYLDNHYGDSYSIKYNTNPILTKAQIIETTKLIGALTSAAIVGPDDGNSVFSGRQIARNAGENNYFYGKISGKEREEKLDKVLKEIKGQSLDSIADKYVASSDPIEKTALFAIPSTGSVSLPESTTELELMILTAGATKLFAPQIAKGLNKVDETFSSWFNNLMGKNPSSTTSLTSGVLNPIPENFARVVGGTKIDDTLARGHLSDAFVTDAKILEGLTPKQISNKLAIDPDNTFTIIEFPSKGIEGIASPWNRSNPQFINGGRTSGGAPEFVIPNTKIPENATIIIVK